MRRLPALLASLAIGAPLEAQLPTPAPCAAYDRCALGLAPRWSGLALVRGTGGERAGELGFFWARDVRPVFAGSDSALRYAGRAVAARRVGAVLTDAGAALLVLGAARRGPRTLGAGVALLSASVPAQFVADGWLSRAVWWHNARFAR